MKISYILNGFFNRYKAKNLRLDSLEKAAEVGVNALFDRSGDHFVESGFGYSGDAEFNREIGQVRFSGVCDEIIDILAEFFCEGGTGGLQAFAEFVAVGKGFETAAYGESLAGECIESFGIKEKIRHGSLAFFPGLCGLGFVLFGY